MKWVKYGLLVSGSILLLILLWQFELITYGLSQARGQWSIIQGSVEISEILEDTSVPGPVKENLRSILEIKEFAYAELGLEPTDIYETVNLDTAGHTMYVVTAAEKYRLQPFTWHFPIAGTVPYKGFFDIDLALREREQLLGKGLDVGIRTAGGWSTLGWIENPLLVQNLQREKGDLVNLVLHEMAHETIYIPDSTALNENVATFIGDAGTVLYLQKYDTLELRSYLDREEDSKQFSDHFIRGSRLLDSLYHSFGPEMADSLKSTLKRELIEDIIQNLDTISFNDPARYRSIFSSNIPNNSYFLSFMRYQSDQGQFYEELKVSFDNDLRKYINVLKERWD